MTEDRLEDAYREGYTDGYNMGLSDGHPLNRAGERGTYADCWDGSITKQRAEAAEAQQAEQLRLLTDALDEHPITVETGIKYLVADLNAEHERAEAAEQQLQALQQVLTDIVDAYDRYRGKGVMPAPIEYERMASLIDRQARASLTQARQDRSSDGLFQQRQRRRLLPIEVL